jgi:hypothetical protein
MSDGCVVVAPAQGEHRTRRLVRRFEGLDGAQVQPVRRTAATALREYEARRGVRSEAPGEWPKDDTGL